jgi:hypothetical protein
MAFLQACWNVLSVDIREVFSDFHAGGLFEKSLNALFTCIFSAYGRNRITGVSRTWRGPWRSWPVFSVVEFLFL